MLRSRLQHTVVCECPARHTTCTRCDTGIHHFSDEARIHEPIPDAARWCAETTSRWECMCVACTSPAPPPLHLSCFSFHLLTLNPRYVPVATKPTSDSPTPQARTAMYCVAYSATAGSGGAITASTPTPRHPLMTAFMHKDVKALALLHSAIANTQLASTSCTQCILHCQ